MTPNGLLQIGVFFLAVLALTKPMGSFMARVFEGERTWLHAVLRPLERLIYKLCGIREEQEQRWTGYAASLLMFSLATLLLTYLIQRIQGLLPFNPQGFGTAHAAQGATAMTPDLAFNTAVSFTTNTNWQSYTPEITMSYLTQMVGLATHNFFSAAAGMADRGGIDPRLRSPYQRKDRQFLGRHDAGYRVCPVAAVGGNRAAVCLAGRDPESQPVYESDHPRRRRSDHRSGASRVAGSHQDAGYERRRFLQRQLRASV